MTLKNYRLIKLGFVVVLAFVASQAIVYKNYILPIALFVASALILMYLRKRVVGVIADERDYATGGKAALLAIQIYSWLAVITTFVLYGLRDSHPFYEPIAQTLGFATCLLMLVYAGLFRYFNKVKM